MIQPSFPGRAAVTVGLLFACLAGGCAEKPPEAEKKPPAPVKTVAAKKEKLAQWTELLGTTMPLPNRVAQVSAPVGGTVVSVLGGPGKGVAEGDRVKAGQALVRLDDRVARANRDKAKAALLDLQEQKKQAMYAVELAAIEVKRLEDLGGAAAGLPALVSKVELEKAKVARKDAQSRLVGVASRQAAADAELKALNAQLEYYTLTAPIAGHLGIVQAVAGQTLTPGMAVAEVIDLDEIDVLCHVPPAAARRLETGQPARVAGMDKPLGRVVYIAVQARAETGNFEVKVRFPNRDAKLRANAVVRVEVLTQPAKERLVIPTAALMEDQDPPLVVVAIDVETKKDEHGKDEQIAKAQELRVITGVRDRQQGLVEIVRLEENTEKKTPVAAKGLLFVKEGGHGLHDGDELKLEGD